MKRFYVFCIVLGTALVGMTLFSKSEPTLFFGTVETKEAPPYANTPVESELEKYTGATPGDITRTPNTDAPSCIKGFMPESLFGKITVGDSVYIHLLVHGLNKTGGIVAKVGSRIVKNPIRLRKSSDTQNEGREVLVYLPKNNNLVFGQKVLVTRAIKKSFFSRAISSKVIRQAYADEAVEYDEPSSPELRNITLDNSFFLSTPLEASGITYLSDLHSFVIISDDTESKRPDLFIMDTTGRITSRQAIKGLSEINDMESLFSLGPDCLYTLSSQSYNKKGKQPRSRTLFVRMRRKGIEFASDGSVPLFDLLLTAASNAPSEKWATFILEGKHAKSVDIEGMAVFNDTLLLGFKSPKLDNRAVILAIANFNAVINTAKLSTHQLSLWRTLPLYDTATATFCGISDLTVHAGQIYGVSTGVSLQHGTKEDVGLLWKYSSLTDSIKIVQNFIGKKPEGITLFGNPLQYCIVFDNGTKQPSQFLINKVLF